MVSWGRVLWLVIALGWGLLLAAGATLTVPMIGDAALADGEERSAGAPVVINEVAWSGTAANGADRWIELYNSTDLPVNLDGWRLEGEIGGSVITLSGSIPPQGYYLIEALHDDTVSDIPADLIAAFAMPDDGDVLLLLDPAGHPVDSANGDGGPWPAGTAGPLHLSMERIDPHAPDGDGNWASNDRVIRNGRDAEGKEINGTPTRWNSAGVLADLVIEKRGPFVVPPGAEVAYTLAFSNSGALTATGVMITDVLPAAVQLLWSSAPYTLTEPVSGTLVWEVGRLAPASGPVVFTLTVQLTSFWTGTMTNTAIISSSTVERQRADNQAAWPVRVDDSGPFADLVIEKGGPARVAAGELLTYTLGLANRGEITATGVVVTDELPVGVVFFSQSSPFSLTQPAPNLLRWEVGAVPLSGQPESWALVGRVTDGVSGTLTNEVVASSVTAEANPADNRASLTTIAVYTPTVRLTAVHYYALQGPDEAVQITNLTAAAVGIGGWTLSDGVTAAVFPPGTTLAGRQSIWAAEQAAAFRSQFGLAPDFERLESDPAVPNLAGSWPAFSNAGDEVILCDADGVIQDVLVYKAGNASQEGWVGPALWPYGRGGFAEAGQILYRKPDELTGRPVRDTDGAADWAQAMGDPESGRRVRYPGWDLELFVQPVVVTESAHLTVVVGPDATYPALLAAVESANESLLIASTVLESTGLAQAVAARASAGVSVTLLVEGDPAGGVSDQERWACQLIEAAGGRCWMMIDDPESKVYDRYAEQVAQFMVVDGQWAAIGSAAATMESMPEDDKENGTAGSRSVWLVTDAPTVVAHLAALFSLDADPIHHRDIGSSDWIGPPPYGYQPVTAPDWTTYTVRFADPLLVEGDIAFEIVQAPENSLRGRDGLHGLLARAGAGDTVLVEQAFEPLHWGDPGSNPVADPNLRLEAYLAAAGRGAQVRLLLDGSTADPSRRSQNAATCRYVRERAGQERLPIRCALANPTGLGIDNQMVLAQIDGRGYVHVGSITGSERANKESRGLALQVQSDAAYDYLARLYERDWPHRVYLPLMTATWPGSADHVLISEVLYDAVGPDDGQEWIELTNPTAETIDLAGWMIGDAVQPDDREGLYLFPVGSTAGPYQTLVIATDGAQFLARYGLVPDYELVDTLPGVPDLIRHPTWGRGDLILSNSGDEVVLLDKTGQPVDVVVWGVGSYPGVVPHPGGTGEGTSLERYPRWVDTDDCRIDWRVQKVPSPGRVP